MESWNILNRFKYIFNLFQIFAKNLCFKNDEKSDKLTHMTPSCIHFDTCVNYQIIKSPF